MHTTPPHPTLDTQVSTRVTRRSEEAPSPQRLSTSEYFQQLVDSPSRPQPKVGVHGCARVGAGGSSACSATRPPPPPRLPPPLSSPPSPRLPPPITHSLSQVKASQCFTKWTWRPAERAAAEGGAEIIATQVCERLRNNQHTLAWGRVLNTPTRARMPPRPPNPPVTLPTHPLLTLPHPSHPPRWSRITSPRTTMPPC